MTEGVTLEYLSAIFNVTCTTLAHALSFDGPSSDMPCNQAKVSKASTTDLFTAELDFGKRSWVYLSPERRGGIFRSQSEIGGFGKLITCDQNGRILPEVTEQS